MKRLLHLLALGALMGASLVLLTMNSLAAHLALLGCAVWLSTLTSTSPFAPGLAALGALLQGAFALPIATALFFGLTFLGRASDARSPVGALAVWVGSLLAGGLSGWLLEGSGAVPIASAMGMIALSLVFLVEVDDGYTRRLRGAARRVASPIRLRMLRAAALRRRQRQSWAAPSKDARLRVERAWEQLVCVAEARANTRASAVLDRRIRSYVRALQSVTHAAEVSSVLSAELDDTALSSLWLEQETLENYTSTLHEASTL